MLYEIRYKQIHPLHLVLLYRMFQCGLHAVFWLHIGIITSHIAAEPHSTVGFFFPSQYLCEMIWLNLCSMVWDRRVLRARPTLFKLALAARYFFVFYCFYLFLLSFSGLVQWGWGFRTDRVSVALFRPCIPDLFE